MKSSEKKKSNFILFLFLFFILLSLVLGFFLGWNLDLNKKKRKVVTTLRIEQEKIKKSSIISPFDTFSLKFINPFSMSVAFNYMQTHELKDFRPGILSYCEKQQENPSIQIISVYFRDLTNGLWIGINEKEKYAPASLNKVPVLLGVLKKAEKDAGYLKKKIKYLGSKEEDYLIQHPEIDAPRSSLIIAKEYTIDKLLNLMICESDNEATMLLVSDIGAENLYLMKKGLGIDEPQFANQNTNTHSVKSYSSFFRILYNSSFVNRKLSNYGLEILSRANYHKGIRKAIPQEIAVSHKFGERDSCYNISDRQILQLHHAGIVYYPTKPFYVCVMIKGTNRAKMEEIIFTISSMIYKEVDKQVKSFTEKHISSDID